MVEHLQHQTTAPLWIFAHRDAVKAAAFDRPFPFGPRGRVVHSLFEWTGRTVFSLAVLWIFGFVVMVKWWVEALRAKSVPTRGVLVATGAGTEAQLFDQFEMELGERAVRVRHDSPRSWGSVSKPDFSSLVKQLSAECVRTYRAIKRSDDPAIGGRFSMWMALIAIRIGTYVFARAWAARLPSDVERLVFISPDVFCFAVLDARKSGRRPAIEYWQHGLLYRAILFPKLDLIYALDREEGLHMNRLCGSPFQSSADRRDPDGDASANLLFASMYDFGEFAKTSLLHVLRDFFDWAKGQGLSIIVRPHPREDESFWSTHFSGMQIDRTGDRFSACVERWKPLFVASWFSTSLVDALRLGYAPVILTEGSVPFLRDMVLPLEQIALNWPAHRSEMEVLARDRRAYRRWVTMRGEEVFSPSPSP